MSCFTLFYNDSDDSSVSNNTDDHVMTISFCLLLFFGLIVRFFPALSRVLMTMILTACLLFRLDMFLDNNDDNNKESCLWSNGEHFRLVCLIDCKI